MMRRLMAAVVLVGCLWLSASATGCVGDEPQVFSPDATAAVADGATNVEATTQEDSGAGTKANGLSCAAASECTSGSCVDGVCCESACTGLCEKCNLPGALGRCEAVADGQDPDNECPTAPLPDAGPPPDDASSDAPEDTGPVVNEPDGGVTGDDSLCAGKCNGKRACAYPDTTKTCGTVFCNSPDTQGRSSCDSQGHCQLGLEACQAYTCPDGADGGTPANGCLKTCTGEADCLPTHFCDVGVCKPKLGNGTACTSVTQCQSSHCVGNVCCNDECNVVGGSCTQANKIGQCTCAACATGSCKLWYRDRDGDGYGDINATVANGDAVPGCAAGADGGAPSPPQAGYVENKTDCFDSVGIGASVHPGQTGWFTSPYGPNNSYDYDCNGQQTKRYYEDTATVKCGYCRSKPPFLCSEYTTCTAANQQSGHTCGGSRVCGTGSVDAYHYQVACGDPGTLYHCGKCAVTGGTPSVTSSPSVPQGCH